MLRFLFLIAALFAAPFIAHALWRIGQGLRPEADGAEGAENAGQPQVPVQVLALTGAGLALIAVFVLAVLGSGETGRDGVYTPPRLEGGRIVPGEIRQAEEPDTIESGTETEAPGEPPSRQR